MVGVVSGTVARSSFVGPWDPLSSATIRSAPVDLGTSVGGWRFGGSAVRRVRNGTILKLGGYRDPKSRRHTRKKELVPFLTSGQALDSDGRHSDGWRRVDFRCRAWAAGTSRFGAKGT